MKSSHSILSRVFAILAFTAVALSASQVSATITICFGNGDCFTGDGTCDGWCPDPPATPTCSAAASYNPATDYLLSISGEAWVVQGTTQSPVASDVLMEFIAKMQRKYPAPRDQKLEAKISEEFNEFIKKHPHGKVSEKRLKTLSKETGLRIVHKDKEKEHEKD